MKSLLSIFCMKKITCKIIFAYNIKMLWQDEALNTHSVSSHYVFKIWCFNKKKKHRTHRKRHNTHWTQKETHTTKKHVSGKCFEENILPGGPPCQFEQGSTTFARIPKHPNKHSKEHPESTKMQTSWKHDTKKTLKNETAKMTEPGEI